MSLTIFILQLIGFKLGFCCFFFTYVCGLTPGCQHVSLVAIIMLFCYSFRLFFAHYFYDLPGLVNLGHSVLIVESFRY